MHPIAGWEVEPLDPGEGASVWVPMPHRAGCEPQQTRRPAAHCYCTLQGNNGWGISGARWCQGCGDRARASLWRA